VPSAGKVNGLQHAAPDLVPCQRFRKGARTS